MSLDFLSVVVLYSAMSVYALAFIAYALDLVTHREPTLAGAGAPAAAAADDRTTGLGRVALALLVLGWALHLVSATFRGWDAGRLPWANMYEFALTGTLIITGVYLILLLVVDVRFLGTFVTGLMLVLLGVAAVRYYVPVVPLQPALQSYWLVIHVFVALAATGFFAVGAALSVTQLLRRTTQRRADVAKRGVVLVTLPDRERLETVAYRVNLVGFILWTFTLIAGAIWAERAWGRYWGWDTKEVWTFIGWVLYAGYIHARATRGWRGTRSAWLGLTGFAAVLFNFGVVNVFFTGLHSYSGL